MVCATDTMATVDMSKVGRGGLAGVLSAMDGAKQGPQDAVFAVPREPTPPRQQAALQLLTLALEVDLAFASEPRASAENHSTCAVTATKWQTLPPITNRCQIACE